MAKLIENLGKNIPPKARLVLVVTGIVAISVSVYMVKTLTSSSGGAQELASKASVIGPPKTEDIDKSRPGEVSIIPKDSPAGQEIEIQRQKEIADAKVRGGGFMDRIKISNSQEVIKDLNENSGGSLLDQNIGGDIDDSLDQRDSIKAQREKLAQAKRNRANGVLDEKAAQYEQKLYQEEIKNDEAFMNQELAKFQDNPYSEYMSNDKIYANNGSSSGYTYYAGDTLNQNTLASKSSSVTISGTNGGGSDAQKMVDRYTKNNTPVKANLDKLDSYRGLGSKDSEESSSDYIDSGYSSVVSPVGKASVASTEHISAGEMHYGILQIGVNTDEIGPVRGIIPGNGKLGEAVLLGTPVMVGEKASIAFKTMSLDGKEYSISAIALDPETMRPGLADNVDRHIFERYFKLAIAAAADGYVDAISNYSTTTSSTGSTQTIYEAMPNANDQLAAAVGKIGEVLIPKFEAGFDRKATVTVDQNKDILIMFMSGFDVPYK